MATAQHRQALKRRLERTTLTDHRRPIREQIARAEEQIRRMEQTTKNLRLQRWRDRMLTTQKAAYDYMRGPEPARTHGVTDDTSARPTETVQAAIDRLQDYWDRIWDHADDDDDHDAQRDTVLADLQQRQQQVWPDLETGDYETAAAAQAGKAGGIDGWTGDDLANLPAQAWPGLTRVLNAMDKTTLPRLWRHARQAHKPKPGATTLADGGRSISADKLRPLSITSCWLRLWSRARYHSTAAQAWIAGWLPEDSYGGRPGISTYTPSARFVDAAKRGHIVATLDLSKAFDRTQPTHAIAAFAKLGIPDRMRRHLEHLWLHQSRWIQYLGATAKTALHVDSALPQGDAWSMAAMNAVLASGLKQATRQWPDAVHATYVDDRSWATKNVDDHTAIRSHWETYGRKIGLHENTGKAKVWRRGQRHRDALAATLGAAGNVTNDIDILGVAMTDANRPGQRRNATEQKRIDATATAFRRIRNLPHNWAGKCKFLRAATSRAAYGWISRPMTTKDGGALAKLAFAASGLPAAADRHLAAIMLGHMADPGFASGYNVAIATLRHHMQPGQPANGTTLATMAYWLRRYGWHRTADRQWTHDDMGETIDADPQQDPRQARKQLERCRHLLREAWRRHRFRRWATSDRRDATQAGNPTYDEKRCKAARKNAEGAHAVAVLTAGTVSDAAFAVMTNDPNNARCCMCGDPNGHWLHQAWHCPANKPPTDEPTDLLQRRLGWPTATTDQRHRRRDDAILRHLTATREKILEARYHGGPRAPPQHDPTDESTNDADDDDDDDHNSGVDDDGHDHHDDHGDDDNEARRPRTGKKRRRENGENPGNDEPEGAPPRRQPRTGQEQRRTGGHHHRDGEGGGGGGDPEGAGGRRRRRGAVGATPSPGNNHRA